MTRRQFTRFWVAMIALCAFMAGVGVQSHAWSFAIVFAAMSFTGYRLMENVLNRGDKP